MSGRDPDEEHRVSTPLELLFDLTFVVAFGIAADELARYLAEDHVRTALLGFAFVAFAISWAWINFSWFASAYDTDDWIYRLLTLLHMVGVLVLALGIGEVFASIDRGGDVHNGVMVAGYVVMRVAMVALWARAARQDRERSAAARTYMVAIPIAQAGWIALAAVGASVGVSFLVVLVLIAVELGGPFVAERQHGGTPWHPHHIAERYGLMIIITLGEAILGTITALEAIVGPDGRGWSVQAVVVGVAGVALAFGMWWIYFVVPAGEILARRRDRAFGFGYGHIPLFAAVVATGAGLHVGAYLVEHETHLGDLGTVLSTAVPLSLYIAGVFAISMFLTGSPDPFHLVVGGLSGLVVAAAVGLAAAGIGFEWCLLVLAATPWVAVVAYERVGHRHLAAAVGR